MLVIVGRIELAEHTRVIYLNYLRVRAVLSDQVPQIRLSRQIRDFSKTICGEENRMPAPPAMPGNDNRIAVLLPSIDHAAERLGADKRLIEKHHEERLAQAHDGASASLDAGEHSASIIVRIVRKANPRFCCSGDNSLRLVAGYDGDRVDPPGFPNCVE